MGFVLQLFEIVCFDMQVNHDRIEYEQISTRTAI